VQKSLIAATVRSAMMGMSLRVGGKPERLQSRHLRGLHLVQHVIAANEEHVHLLVMHDDDRLHGLLDGNPEKGADLLACVLAGCRYLLHRRRRRGARCLRRKSLGKLDVRGVIGAAADRDRILARAREHLELVRPGAADLAGVGRDRAKLEAQAREDARVRVVHRLVALLQAFEIGVERVRVLHREFTRAHHAEARADLVAELGLDLVKVERKLAVALHFPPHEVAEHLFRGGRVAELALGAILDAQHQRAVKVPTPGLLPQFRRLHGRRQHLERPGAVHLLAHDGLHLSHHAQSQRHPCVKAAREFADERRPQHELVAREFGLLGRFLEGRQVVLGRSHELWGLRGVELLNSEIKSSSCVVPFYTGTRVSRRLAGARKL
jgi:hypothetical protein